mmetsp:Transcript_46114/g.93071  ORF Transcript_46114/g.93071 Transcript_46114/m.93071 type:complete len:359 (+) Transcript_46114:12-1088(+)
MQRLAAALLCFFARTSAMICTSNTTASDIIVGRDLSGQLHVLTGGDSGIGYETALALAAANATLIIASYDAAGQGLVAAENITAATGNAKITVVEIDLSSLASVATAAAAIKALVPSGGRIDVLICDAGIGNPTVTLPDGTYALTADGFDETMEVNFIGHVALIEGLSPLLHGGGRLIHVSSAASYSACDWGNYPEGCGSLPSMDAEVRKSPAGTNPESTPASNYGLSKYAMVFHAAEYAINRFGILAFSLHPGIVATPITAALPPKTLAEWCASTPPGDPCPLTAAEGAATPTFLASATTAEVAENSGKYFYLCKPEYSVIDEYEAANGPAATLKYQAQLYNLALVWAGAPPAIEEK